MDSASEKGALLQGLCPGISCVFNKHVQLFDWMIVKWVLFLWVIWLFPSLWQQVLRLRLQDNSFILHLLPPAWLLVDLTKISGKISKPENGKNCRKDLTRPIGLSRTVWTHAKQERKHPAREGVSKPAAFHLRHVTHIIPACLFFLSSPLTLANLETNFTRK